MMYTIEHLYRFTLKQEPQRGLTRLYFSNLAMGISISLAILFSIAMIAYPIGVVYKY